MGQAIEALREKVNLDLERALVDFRREYVEFVKVAKAWCDWYNKKPELSDEKAKKIDIEKLLAEMSPMKLILFMRQLEGYYEFGYMDLRIARQSIKFMQEVALRLNADLQSSSK